MTEDFDNFIGLTYEQAKILLREYPDLNAIRICSQDGQAGFGTADYRLDRLNVDVIQNVIMGVRGRG